MLGLRRELADRHVLDHAPAQRAYCLVGHGDAPVLSEGCEPLISRQDAPLRYRLGCAASRSLLPRERFSSLGEKRTSVRQVANEYARACTHNSVPSAFRL